jgi:hypothetical protein
MSPKEKDVSVILNEIKNIVDKQLEHTNHESSIGSEYVCFEFVMRSLQDNFYLYFIYQSDNTVLVSNMSHEHHDIIEIADPMFFQKISASVKSTIEGYINNKNKEMEAIMEERRAIVRLLQT